MEMWMSLMSLNWTIQNGYNAEFYVMCTWPLKKDSDLFFSVLYSSFLFCCFVCVCIYIQYIFAFLCLSEVICVPWCSGRGQKSTSGTSPQLLPYLRARSLWCLLLFLPRWFAHQFPRFSHLTVHFPLSNFYIGSGIWTQVTGLFYPLKTNHLLYH